VWELEGEEEVEQALRARDEAVFASTDCSCSVSSNNTADDEQSPAIVTLSS